ncbi:MAG: dioxygenase [Candidatus Aenigmarchaeota archaeon]|nr:dioxygenase [Candidatus Aenigmarchaeota archaeon]
MTFVYGLLVPHGPDLLTLGKGLFDGVEEKEKRVVSALHAVREKIRKISPDLIVSSSPHWMTQGFSIDASLNPKCIYDYHGFPVEFYNFNYSARNDLAMATKILASSKESGIKAKLLERGLDHGHWIPLHFLSPNGSIPVVPVSIATDTPEAHIAFGKAVAKAIGSKKAVFVAGGALLHRLDTISTMERIPEGESYLREAIANIEKGEIEKIFDIDGYYDAAPEGNLGTLMELFGAMGAPGKTLANEVIAGLSNTVMEFT